MSNAPAPLRGTITTFIDAVDAWVAAQAAVDSEINPLTAVGPNPPDPGHSAQWSHVKARNDALADRRNEITRTGNDLVQLLAVHKEDELAVAVQAVVDAASEGERVHIDQTRRAVKARLRVLAAKEATPPAPGPATSSIPLSDADCIVLAMLAARYRDGSSVVDWRPVEKVLLDSGYPVLQERRLIRQTLNALTLAGAVEPIHKPPRRNSGPVFFADENEPDEWRILPRAVSLAAEMANGATQTESNVESDVAEPPTWDNLGDAKRAILQVLNAAVDALQNPGVAGKAGYTPGSLRHHYADLKRWKLIESTKDGYKIMPAGKAMIPAARV